MVLLPINGISDAVKMVLVPTIHYDSLSNQKSFVSGYGKLGDSAVKTVEAGASLIDSDGLLQGQQAVPILRTRLKRWEPK